MPTRNPFSRMLPLVTLLVIGIVAVSGTKPSSQASHSPQAKQTADPVAAIRANNLGAAYMNQQRMEPALAEFEKAYAADPKLTAARVNQGIALLNLQRIEPARTTLREITARDPKNIRAWYNLGILEKNAGDADASLAAFEKAAALDPAGADTQYFIGTLLAQLGRYPDAIAAFERAIALNRFHVSAEFGLARAMQRSGNAEQARLHLARFQHLNTEKLGAPMSLAYGDQGQYSLAETVTLPPSAAPPSIPVKFTSIPASESGLRFSGAADFEPHSPTAGGGCVVDYNNDGYPDLFLLGNGRDSASALFRNDGRGHFADVTEEAKIVVRGHASACAAGDFDNDGWTDIAMSTISGLLVLKNQRDGTFAEVARKIGIESHPGQECGVQWVDFDHDGDLDLYLTKPSQLWRNNGNSTFSNWTDTVNIGQDANRWSAQAIDFNNDRTIDVVFAGPNSAATLFLNRREGAFAPQNPWGPSQPSQALGIAVLDFDKDGWMDVALTHRESEGGLTLWRNIRGDRLEPVRFPRVDLNWGLGVAAIDYDSDGWIDLAAVGQSGIRLFHNSGREGFRDVSTASFPGTLAGSAVTVLALDYDAEGDTDFVITHTTGPVVLLRNDGGNKNNWLKLSLKGLADNKSAIGTKVEVFAGATYQKFEVTTPNDLLIGLGPEKQADVVRLLWPTGVLQDEVNLAANQRHEIVEIDRRGSSCPVLFAWNGSRYEFIADAIGPGIVGHWVAPGVRNTSDPTEYIKVPGSLLRERRGPRGERRLSFRFAEPMEEIVYLDQLRLFAVDHPSDIDVNPSERFYASGPPFPTGAPVFTSGTHAHAPVHAVDDHGRDVTALLRNRDHRYVTDFADAPYKGFAELHWIELDLGDAVAAAQTLRLLLHGYTDYFTATSVYAAHQGGVTAIVPYVEALTPEGKWVRIEDDMGFPAGLARTMVADLTGKLPPGTRRIRIVTNLKVYWDQVLIDTTLAGTPHRISEAPLAAATSDFLGYPREIRGQPESDIRYHYDSVSATGPYARAAGHYTRYGDVRALVTASDDRFVIMGSGDEVAVEFDPAALPPLPAGWTRDWFVYVDGFAKDMDFYAAHPFTVTPLPYHAMPGYPYPTQQPYPDRGVHLDDQLDLNTRAVSGRPAPSYRYHYAGRTAPSSQPPRRTAPRK